MNQPDPPAQPPPAPPRAPVTTAPARPVVRLPTWVNVVLVLILLASCSGARDDLRYSEDDLVQRIAATLEDSDRNSQPGASQLAEIEDLCRLMGAVAAKQGVSTSVMDPNAFTRCHELAQEAAGG
jgi:hypothetical protein